MAVGLIAVAPSVVGENGVHWHMQRVLVGLQAVVGQVGRGQWDLGGLGFGVHQRAEHLKE